MRKTFWLFTRTKLYYSESQVLFSFIFLSMLKIELAVAAWSILFPNLISK